MISCNCRWVINERERREAKRKKGKGQKPGPKTGAKGRRMVVVKERLNSAIKKESLTIKTTSYNRYDKLNHRNKIKNRELSVWQKVFLDKVVIENRWYSPNSRDLRPEIRNCEEFFIGLE